MTHDSEHMAINASRRMIRRRRWLCISTGFSISLASCDSWAVQAQDQFEIGVRNPSSSPSIVKIELIENGHDSAMDQCVYGRDLLFALLAEHNLPSSLDGVRRAFQIADETPRHRFIFQSKVALNKLNIARNRTELAKGCEIIRSGRPAQRDDLSGRIVEGQPDKETIARFWPNL